MCGVGGPSNVLVTKVFNTESVKFGFFQWKHEVVYFSQNVSDQLLLSLSEGHLQLSFPLTLFFMFVLSLQIHEYFSQDFCSICLFIAS